MAHGQLRPISVLTPPLKVVGRVKVQSQPQPRSLQKDVLQSLQFWRARLHLWPPSLVRIRSDPRSFCYHFNFTIDGHGLFANTVKMFSFHCSGKTSLLFQHALRCAEKGIPVLFVSPSPLDQLPLLGKDSHSPSPHLLKSIQFKSVQNPIVSTTVESLLKNTM